MTGQEIPDANFAKGGSVAPAAGLASLLASQGRNGDSTLVHMTPDEVRGLQAIARSRGMELPINPVTGLPEANFLTSFLSSIWKGTKDLGIAALQNPQLASTLIGGAYGAVKGDLQKGLEAGMKAYAGLNLVGGIPSVARAVDSRIAEDAKKYATNKGGTPEEK
jgi:hypothetical protein